MGLPGLAVFSGFVLFKQYFFFFFFFLVVTLTHLVIVCVRVSKANERHPIAVFRLLCTRRRVCYVCICALPGLAGFSGLCLAGEDFTFFFFFFFFLLS